MRAESEIETQIDNFKADIKSQVQNSATQHQINMEKQAIQNHQNMENLQKSMNQMIRLSLLQDRYNKRKDDLSKNSEKAK